MKFTAATLVSLVLVAVGSVDAYSHVRDLHHRRGVSATPTVPSQPTSTPTPPPVTGPGSAKRGLSYNDVGLTKNFKGSNEITWAYNWASQSGGQLPDGITYFPMLWCDDTDHTNTWVNDANAAIAGGSTHLLGFNEPDLSGQCNISPQQAATSWKQWMQPFAGKAQLVSPAITNGGAPLGQTWMDSFLTACTGCTIDAIAIHIYDSPTNLAYFQNYISGVVTKYGKPVMVTEFGTNGGSDADRLNFVKSMNTFLDGLDGVSKYAFFMDAAGGLVNGDSSLSPLGNAYFST